MASFGVGAVVGTSWRVWSRNVVAFVLIGCAVYVPALVLWWTVPAQDWLLYMVPLRVMLDATLAATLTYGVVKELEGTRPSLAACVRHGLGQLVSVLGVVVLSGLAIVGGLLLFIAPGVLAALAFYVAVPAGLVEKLSATAALRRSRELTRGRRGMVFALYLVTYLGSFGLAQAALASFDGPALAYVTIGLEAIIASFLAVTAAVVYVLLRREKEGVSVPELATAFARFKS